MESSRLIKRITSSFIITAIIWAYSPQHISYAQDKIAAHRIAIVKSRDLAPYNEATEGIEVTLYRHLHDISIEHYTINGDITKGNQIASSISQKNIHLIFTVGTEATTSMFEFGPKKIPIVSSMIYEPTDKMLNAEHNNLLYGASLNVPWEVRLRSLKELLPEWKKYSVIHLPNTSEELIEHARTAAKEMDIQINFISLTSLSYLLPTIEKESRNSDALIMILDRKIYNPATIQPIFLKCAKNRYPIVTFSPNYVKAGALVSISVNFRQNGIDAATLGLQVLESRVKAPFFPPSSQTWITWNKRVSEQYGVFPDENTTFVINEYID